MQYSEKVMDHFTNPRNVGEIENAEGVGVVGNAKCGDIMKIYLKIENDVIVDCKFKTFGCGAGNRAATGKISEPVSNCSEKYGIYPDHCSCCGGSGGNTVASGPADLR